MIKIIKKGNCRQTATFTCPICSTVFSFEKSDVKCTTSDCIFGAVDTIDCPVCNKTIEVIIDDAFPWLPPLDYYKDN